MDLINSPHNAAIKHLVKLGESARYRRECGEVLLDGVHLLDACLTAGYQPKRVFVAAGMQTNAAIVEILHRIHAPVSWVSDPVLARASELKTPTGILSVWQPQTKQGPGPALRQVWLDEVQDPGNVGSILRSAAAAGFDTVRLSPGCADPWSPRVLRAAMGAHFLLDIHTHMDLPSLVTSFEGCMLATALGAEQSLYQQPYSLPVAWVFGNEGEGVSAALLQHATHQVSIPMPGAMESLNVAAAAAVCLFEDVRRRIRGDR